MTSEGSSHATHDPRLNHILAEYVEALESGIDQNPDEWLARYPEFATELREFMSDHGRLRDVVEQAAAGLALQAANAPTLLGTGAANSGCQSSPRLRYFGDYELHEEIARGGMGVVFRARQVSLNRPVAIKMILAGEFAAPEDVSRFRAEAEAAANLDHPGIVPIYEIGACDGHHYFSMKFIRGESLAQRIKRESAATGGAQLRRIGEADLRSRVQLVANVAKAVHFAHQRGIIHRDLKPGNILIDENGSPHVTDFGLAKSLSGDSQLTHTGAVVGTPSYMAPEQASGDGKRVTTAADIYGLGAILYAVLTGRPPFEGPTPLDTLLQVQNQPPDSPHKTSPAVDAELEIICLKCLAKAPQDRYHSAGELADDLERWVRREPIRAAPPNLARLLRRWVNENFRGAALVVLLGLAIGCMICQPPINVLAHNLSPYLSIYRGTFGQHAPPGVLVAISSYPRWIGIVALPLLVPVYFGMGWIADRLVRPKDQAAAIMSGTLLGSTAAVTAFLLAIGWQSLIQVAVWPSLSDLELLAAAIDGDTTFTGGRALAEVYPPIPQGHPLHARQVMAKIIADIQSRIPLGLAIGFLFSIGALLLPAAVQTWLAFVLRSRGDSRREQLLHLVELSIPATLMLVAWGYLLWDRTLVACSLLAFPVLVAAVIQCSRRWSLPARRAMFVCLGVLALVFTAHWADSLFSMQAIQPISFGHMAAGTVAVTFAVFQRWRWWVRACVYLVWLATLLAAGGAFAGSGTIARNADAQANPNNRIIVSVVGTIVVLAVTGWAAWVSRQREWNARATT